MDEFRDLSGLFQGYCTVCEDFTRDSTEPDAEGYDCPICGQDAVMGVEQALLLGEIDISG